MEREAKCPVCGKIFTAHRATERYCSAACRRYAYRHRDEAPPSQRASSGKTLRSFRCIRCGKLVVVTQGADKRRKFCSPHCERLYWKHSKNVESQPVQHSFCCRNCGVLVEIRDAKDRRTAFCSADCRKQWFSLHRKNVQTYRAKP
ncbi:hypothetical protein [Megasphaera stantonii]|uniref:hypothetical protein n=1 Tax=Megasphaera stantonii TaxID=2144175 RepID=UPI0029428DF5|nr:hypothetical protein [Megasphaera stantonii]